LREAADFYRNKQVRLIVGHPVGNDHDVADACSQNISASTFRAGPTSSSRT